MTQVSETRKHGGRDGAGHSTDTSPSLMKVANSLDHSWHHNAVQHGRVVNDISLIIGIK